MAAPIEFKPKSVDPRFELQRRLAAAPEQHAEALLVAYDLLEEAHRQGLLGALHGLIGAKATIAGAVAGYAADPNGAAALRTLLALGKMLGALNPEPISNLSKEMQDGSRRHGAAPPPPSLWQLFKRMRVPEARRGLASLVAVLAALGRAVD